MKAGAYNRDATAQATAATFGVDQLVAAAHRVPTQRPVRIVDYGASQGLNSLAPLSAAIDAIRADDPSAQVEVVHMDLPTNDFTSLMATVAGDPHSYLRPGVFPMMTGGSFYRQVVADGSVSLGWCSISLHWLDDAPGPLPGIWSATAPDDVRSSWRTASADDWRRFLDARAAELQAGATLVVVCGAADASGASGAEPAMDLLDDCLQSMAADGTLTAAEYADMAIPAWYRTEAEWREPFGVTPLLLRSYQEVVLGDPLWAATGPDSAAGSVTGYAAAVAAAIRVSFGPSLLAGVGEDRRPAVEAELFGRRYPDAIADRGVSLFAWRVAILAIASPAGSPSPEQGRPPEGTTEPVAPRFPDAV